MPGILHVGLVLVHEAPPTTVEQDPAHRHVLAQALIRPPVRQALQAYAERIVKGRVGKTVGAVIVPHMPELRAHALSQAQAIAGIRAHRGRQHRIHRPELTL